MQVRYQLKCQTIKRVKHWERLPGSTVKNLALEVFEAGSEEHWGMLQEQDLPQAWGTTDPCPSGYTQHCRTACLSPQKQKHLTSLQKCLVRLGFSDQGHVVILFEITHFSVLNIRKNTFLLSFSPQFVDISELRSVLILICIFMYTYIYIILSF